MIVALRLFALPLFCLLLLALDIAGRFRDAEGHLEAHHGYWGIFLVGLPWVWAVVLGLILLADDLWQHGTQAVDVMEGRAPRADFTFIHRFGAWLLGKLYVLFGRAA